MSSEILVKAENVSKKFCRDLKRSLWYGVKDMAREVFGDNSEKRLRKQEFWAVDDVSFELRRGECLGLIGHNGAGKSTLLKILNGLIKPDKGRVTMKGRIGALIELGAGFNPLLTGRENIYINGQILGFNKHEIDQKFDQIVEFSEINDFIDTPVQNYSSGMKVRLGFAVASQMEPDILIIDEVLAVGDVGFRMKCFNRIFELSEKAAVILVSHSMSQVSRVATKILLMNKGKALYNDENIAVGIEKYFDLFGTEKTSAAGDGKAILSSFVVNGSSGSPDAIPVINYQDSLELDMEFMVDSKVDNFTIHLGIMDRELKTIAQCFSRISEVDFKNNGKPFKIKVNIPNMPLAMGTYSINVNFMENTVDSARGAYLGHYRAIQHFKVKSQSALIQSPIQLNGTWKIISNN